MAADTTEVSPAGAQLDAAVPARSRHLGLALVVISMAQLMLVLDELIVNTALPHIQQALHFSGTGLEWVVTGYAVTFGGLLMLGGRAGDILGRRRMFSAGILFFTLASLLGGLATSSWLLITARVLQGAGAALAAPAGLSLITVTFPEGKLRTRALGMYAAMTGLGGGVGVVAGGLLTTYASWRWVFFVNVPIGLLLAFGARFAIPESQRYPRRWDLPGAITGTAGFALLIYGLTRGATGPDGISHWADTGTILALAGAAAAISRVRGHRGTVPPAAAALADLRQPEPDRRLPDPALPGLDILRHVLLPHPVHPGRVGVQRAARRPCLPAVRRRLHRGRRHLLQAGPALWRTGAHDHRRPARPRRNVLAVPCQ